MYSSIRLKLLRSTFRFRTVCWRELTAVGALLSCFAVVLNVSPVTRTFEAAPGTAEQSVGSALVLPSEINESLQSNRSQPNLEAIESSEQFVPVMELSSVQDSTFARLAFQPVGPRNLDVAMQPGPATQDPGATNSTTRSLTTIVGVWAPDAGACSVRNFREGLLPTIINTDGAWAGDSFCVFKNHRQTGTSWKVVASCSNSRERWTTDVRLTVKDNRLTWTSKRGTQTYSRCATDFLISAGR